MILSTIKQIFSLQTSLPYFPDLFSGELTPLPNPPKLFFSPPTIRQYLFTPLTTILCIYLPHPLFLALFFLYGTFQILDSHPPFYFPPKLCTWVGGGGVFSNLLAPALLSISLYHYYFFPRFVFILGSSLFPSLAITSFPHQVRL